MRGNGKGRRTTKFVERFCLSGGKLTWYNENGSERHNFIRGGDWMHTLETAVVLPLLFVVMVGGLLLSIHTVDLIDKQVTGYIQTPGMDSADCVQVLRIAEVVYDTLEEFERP